MKTQQILTYGSADARAHAQEHGYDLHHVTRVRCLCCNCIIGRKPYVAEPIFARFGSMMFVHATCDGQRGKKPIPRHKLTRAQRRQLL